MSILSSSLSLPSHVGRLLLGLVLLGTLAVPSFAGTAPSSKAEQLLRRGDVEGAITATRESLRKNPSDLDAHELLIDTYLSLGLGETIETHYHDKATQNLGSADAWYLYGRAATQADAARSAYDRALSLRPEHARALMGLGAIDRAQNQLEAAQGHYERALALDPSLPEAWAGLGACHLARGEPESALTIARKALTQVPTDPEAYLIVASLDSAHAISVLKAGADAVPDESRLHLALGREYLEKGEARAALQSIERALSIRPGLAEGILDRELALALNAGTLDSKGIMRLMQARDQAREAPQAALGLLDGLAKDHPSSAMVQAARGHVLSSLQRNTEAEAAFRSALALSPSDAEASAGLGLLLLVKDQPAQAVPFLETARRQRPSDSSLAMALGMAKARSESAGAGMAVLAQAVKDFPSDPRPMVSLAAMLSRAGDREGAWRLLAENVRKNPHPNVIVALANAARDTDRVELALQLLDQLALETGDPRFSEAAAGIREARAKKAP